MPEISEVARIVHFLRTHLKNRRIASVTAEDDPIVYGKVGTSADAFKAALTGRTVVDAKQQGKYFWLEMDKPPHALMHFGMSGWLKFRHVDTYYYKPKKEADSKKQSKLSFGKDSAEADAESSPKPEDQDWPPRFHKFVLKMEGEPACEAAFVDARRLGRIRLVDVPAGEMRKSTPLKENGPDPVIDKDILTEQWLKDLLHRKKSPVKAVLLDQANISGVGNWVGDEVLYHAAIHPEQYSNTLSDAQCKKLHDALMYVCTTSCDLLGDSDRFPDNWIFKHRWNKGKNTKKALPSGEEMIYITVGGRTSAVVPSVQKKTGAVAGDVEEEEDASASSSDEDVKEKKPKAAPKKQAKKKTEDAPKTAAKRKSDAIKSEDSKPAASKKAKSASKTKEANGAPSDRSTRRSGRLSKT